MTQICCQEGKEEEEEEEIKPENSRNNPAG